MYGDGFGIHGIWILIAILIFGKMFGMAGMLLAVPLAAIISIIYEEYLLKRMEEKRKIREEREILEAASEQAEETAGEEETPPAEDTEELENAAELEKEKWL